MRKHVTAMLPLILLVQTAVASAQVTAIRAGRVVDPDAGTAAERQVILVENGKITAIGGNVNIPAGAQVIDLSSSTISPGLVDAHTHLCMDVQDRRDAGSYYYTTLRDPDAMRAVQGVVNARTMLQAGFTTVRDVGNEGRYACVQVRRAIQQGRIIGPTMITAGRIIAPYGGQFHLQPDKPALAEPEYYFADTRDEMVKAVRENAHYGATVIKIVVDDQRYIYSVDDIAFIKAEAAAAGLKLAAHAWTRPGAHNAAAAGVTSIEHGFDMIDADLELAKKNGVALVGTEYLAKEDTGAAHRQWVDRLRRANKIGVLLVYGTDATRFIPTISRGVEAMTGIDPWVEAGIPAPVILKAMTTNATRLLGVDDVRGTLKVGQYADLIATPDNPLTNIQTLKQVSFCHEGREGRAALSAFPERGLTRREFVHASAAMFAASPLSQLRPLWQTLDIKSRLILLGTAGGPTPKPNRAAPAQVIVVNDACYVVDCGNGVARQMVLAKLKLGSIRSVFITHHHSDHNADYGNLLLLGWAADLASRVDTYGPPPLKEMTREFLALNDVDIRTRIADEGRPPLEQLIAPHEITAGGVVMQDDNVKVTAAVVDHPPLAPVFAYRFDCADRSIVISGDTRPTRALVELARGADVLVHEVMHVPSIEALIASEPNAKTLREHLLASHTTTEQVGRLATEAQVKTLVLSHFVPGGYPFLADDVWYNAVRPYFSGNLIVGRDLLEI